MLRTRRVNLFANITLALAVTVFLWSFGWRFFAARGFASASVSPDGKRIAISGVNFSASPQTVLLVLDKDCRFCRLESNFYRRLTREASARGVRVIAAFQHDLGDAEKYLSDEMIDIPVTIRIEMKALGVQGTPTLILLNREGEALGRWAGGLSDDLRDYIISILGKSDESIKNDASSFFKAGNVALPPSLDPGALSDGLGTNDLVLLDVDERDEFAAEHIAGAVNIPEDEVYARALNELPTSGLIVIFSRSRSSTVVSNTKVNLEEAGFSRIAVLNLTLEECKAAGLKTEQLDSKRSSVVRRAR